MVFTVRALVGSPTDIGAQKTLDGFLNPDGALSVKAAVEKKDASDGTRVTLGGKVDDVRVTRADSYTSFVLEGRPPLLAAEWAVDVYV
jgi:hypothetical protein